MIDRCIAGGGGAGGVVYDTMRGYSCGEAQVAKGRIHITGTKGCDGICANRWGSRGWGHRSAKHCHTVAILFSHPKHTVG